MPEFTEIVMLAVAVYLLAGVIKGTVGIGLPTVSVGILSQFVPPHTAVALVVFPLLVSNFWQALRARAGLVILKRYAVLCVCLFLSLWATTFLTAKVSTDLLMGAIGCVMLIFAITNLLGVHFTISDRHDRAAQVITGLTAGVLGGLTSIWGPPLVAYLMGRRTGNDEFVGAAGIFLFVGGIPLMIGFWQTGLMDGQTAQLSAALIIPTLIGFSIGELIRRRLDTKRFKTILLWMFLLMGLNLLRRSLF